MRTALHTLNFEVTEASIGEAALDLLRKFVSMLFSWISICREWGASTPAGRFAAHSGLPMIRAHLPVLVWGPEYGGALKCRRTFMRQSRRKLEDDPSQPVYLLTEAMSDTGSPIYRRKP